MQIKYPLGMSSASPHCDFLEPWNNVTWYLFSVLSLLFRYNFRTTSSDVWWSVATYNNDAFPLYNGFFMVKDAGHLHNQRTIFSRKLFSVLFKVHPKRTMLMLEHDIHSTGSASGFSYTNPPLFHAKGNDECCKDARTQKKMLSIHRHFQV